MNKNQWIRELLEAQMHLINPLFLYKDQQLLKEGHYEQLMERQLKKSRKLFMVGTGVSIVHFLLSLIILIMMWDLTWSVAIALLGVVQLFLVTKQHYSITSSIQTIQSMMKRNI